MEKSSLKYSPPLMERGYTIGELSLRTGLSVLRIRAWETRHGVPRSYRAPSGHRRYTAAEALRLDLLSQAVRAGGRIGDLSLLNLEELAHRLPGTPTVLDPVLESPQDQWLDWIRNAQERALRDAMEREWKRVGWLAFLDRMAIPYLRCIGDAWESGVLGIAQEHFASGVLVSILENHWRMRNSSNDGPPLLLAMLPGDSHSFGLHMCAVAIVHAHRRVLWMGPNSPAGSVLSAVTSWDVAGLCLSLSPTSNWKESRPFLQSLRKEIPMDIPFYAGGTGLRGSLKGIHTFPDFGAFHDHLAR